MIYLTSKWSNTDHLFVRRLLDVAKLTVYDYRESGKASALEDPTKCELDRKILEDDLRALELCTSLVALLPGGRGLHIEMGYVLGKGCPVFIYKPEISFASLERPELLYHLAGGAEAEAEAGGIFESIPKLIEAVSLYEGESRSVSIGWSGKTHVIRTDDFLRHRAETAEQQIEEWKEKLTV